MKRRAFIAALGLSVGAASVPGRFLRGVVKPPLMLLVVTGGRLAPGSLEVIRAFLEETRRLKRKPFLLEVDA